MILKNVLSNNFLWFNSFHISVQSTVIQNHVPESGHATVKYFIKYFFKFRNFERFLMRLCPIFFFLKIVLVYWHCIKTSKFVFLSLVMSQQSISLLSWNFERFFKPALSHVFVCSNNSCVLALYKNTQTRVPESGHHSTVNIIESLSFWMFLNQTLSHACVS